MFVRCLAILSLTLIPTMLHAQTTEEYLQEAASALDAGKPKDAIRAADLAIMLTPDSVRGHLLRGDAYAALREHQEAIRNYEKVIALDPEAVIALDRRGNEYFKLGRIDDAIKDFETYLEARPEDFVKHWRYGIACYYAERYERGVEQFKAGEEVFGDDVENAFWHYLCNAKARDVGAAREDLLKVGPDLRIPMMEIYKLVQGQSTPEKVLEVASDPELPKGGARERLFYAHLYIGLNYEALGDREKMLKHIRQADALQISHYMWDVAHVHLLKREAEENPE